MYAGMAYFVRQRDRFQQESDDLLHNILPDEIATRLKSDKSMIAEDFPHASVLFADVVGFTPMSATMAPPQLVGLLNQVFTKFDEFVEELGLEKIKTVGDEYMVAAGVPVPRDDHAEAIAELALRIRDYMASNDFDRHRLELRIGINSGPVVAGIIGTHKFTYDLWGDTVNTASRMESGGISGQIQVPRLTTSCSPPTATPSKPGAPSTSKAKAKWTRAPHRPQLAHRRYPPRWLEAMPSRRREMAHNDDQRNPAHRQPALSIRQSALAIRYLGTTFGGRPVRPWQCLYFSPDPHGQRSLRPTFGVASRRWPASFAASSNRCAGV